MPLSWRLVVGDNFWLSLAYRISSFKSTWSSRCVCICLKPFIFLNKEPHHDGLGPTQFYLLLAQLLL